MVTVEELSKEVAKRQATGDESVLTPVPAMIAPSDSLQSQRKSINHKNILSDSPVDIMSSVGVPEQSPTNGLVGAILSAAGVSLTPVSSPSSSENLYYLGGNIDGDNVHPAHDTCKFSHLTEKEMQVAVPEKELPLKELLPLKGILSASL